MKKVPPGGERTSGFVVPGHMPEKDAAKRMLSRYERAKTKRDQFAPNIDAAYEFALPLRQRGYMGNTTPDTDRLFDATAVTAIQGLASQMLDDVWPADQTPFELRAGPGVDEKKREEVNKNLAQISAQVIDAINNSAFRSAAHEAFLDYCIGTGVMLIEEGDAITPVLFRSVPLTGCVLDVGPRDDLDFLGIPRKIQAAHVMTLWPKAKMPEALERMAREAGETEIEVVEGVERDWSRRNAEVWIKRVIWRDAEAEPLLEETTEGVGSRPFVAPSFTRASGETMGRGPVLLALPDIRTVNKLVELLLEHADLALSGIWLADDDGVINVDTVELEPGVIIPRAAGVGKGLENVGPTGNFQVGQMQLDQLRASIKEAMYVNDLGDINKTPKTAMEIGQRTADRAKRLSGTYGRLLTEFLFPLVSRVWWLLKKQAGHSGLPPVDGDAIRVRPLSPLTRAQSQDDVTRHITFMQTLAGILGPQAPMLMVDVDAFARFLSDKMGFNPNLLRSKSEQQALMQQAMQMAQQAGMVPGQAAPAQGAAPA